jgi:hypothetical protein
LTARGMTGAIATKEVVDGDREDLLPDVRT